MFGIRMCMSRINKEYEFFYYLRGDE